jgi:hypothetical protein
LLRPGKPPPEDPVAEQLGEMRGILTAEAYENSLRRRAPPGVRRRERPTAKLSSPPWKPRQEETGLIRSRTRASENPKGPSTDRALPRQWVNHGIHPIASGTRGIHGAGGYTGRERRDGVGAYLTFVEEDAPRSIRRELRHELESETGEMRRPTMTQLSSHQYSGIRQPPGDGTESLKVSETVPDCIFRHEVDHVLRPFS